MRPDAEAVAQHAKERLHDHEAHQRAGHDEAGAGGGESAGQHQELLHVGGEGVEIERPADREEQHQRHGAPVPEHGAQRAGVALCPAAVGGGLDHVAPKVKDRDGPRRAHEEGDPPPPCVQVVGAEQLLKADDREKRQELPGDDRHILQRTIETPPALGGDLAEICGARAVFRPHRQALQKPGEEKEGGGEHADLRIARQDRDQERPDAHQ